VGGFGTNYFLSLLTPVYDLAPISYVNEKWFVLLSLGLSGLDMVFLLGF
jgi:hypothetical protein